DLSETPEYLGRAVAALAADPRAVERGGTVAFVADLARAYGFNDADGRQPPRFDPGAPVEP
ncbi:MAG TPA: short-chain dehydrogenase, partial [Myxococcales bacterium]|nr:short-chain dehydrogenase [Myxococcales bacterium]